MGTGRRRARTAAAWAAVWACCAAHGWMCWQYAGGAADFFGPWPYLVDDYPLHHANAVAARAHLANSWTNAGYDPFAFSGHVKSSFWPTHPQLELAVAALAPPVRPELVTKGYALAAAAALPWSILWAGALLRLPAGTIAVAAAMWTAAFWQTWPFQTSFFLRFGMTAFLASVAWSLPAAAACWRWLDSGRWRDAFRAAGLLALACMAHPTVPILLAPPLAVRFFAQGLWRRRWRQAAAIAVAAVAANGWWLLPLALLGDTVAAGPTYFVNRNVAERLADLVTPRIVPGAVGPSWLTVLVAGAAVAGWRRPWMPGLLWIAALALLAGGLPALDGLQAGRNTLHLLQWLALPGAAGLCALWRAGGWRRWLAAAAALWAGATSALEPQATLLRALARGDTAVLAADLPPWHADLFARLRNERPAGRILWEACEGGKPAAEVDGPLRAAPLVAAATRREVLGGPYLQAHYHAAFAQCGEGTFLRGPWHPDRFAGHAALYRLDHAVLWSEPALAFASEHPNLLEPLAAFKGYGLFRVRRPAAPWEAAGLKVAADHNRVDVENPRGARGRFVLPYHWFRGFRAEPPIPVRAERQGEDPVPFIALDDPPPRVVLRWSPWHLLGAR